MALVPSILSASLITYGVWESRRHRDNLARIPIRVHVNGTRGKSSVTRLIAGGLRAGGLRVVAKTTGTAARLIHPDGSETDVFRIGGPNIIEQTRVVRWAARERAEALVVECMAVTPELQPIAEQKLIQSTLGIITNVRADHLDLMGPTVDDAAGVLAETIPTNGHAFTAERERFGILDAMARGRGSRLILVEESEVSESDLSGFSYFEHAENVAVALAACSHLGVDRNSALRGMQQATPDPGVLHWYTVHLGTREIKFINAFAANDPDSTFLIWNRLGLDRKTPGVRRIVLANCRADRIQRSSQLAELLARRLSADHVVLSGEGTGLVAQRAVAYGLDRDRLTNLGGRNAESVFELIFGLVEDRAVVIGIGNIVGLGHEISLHFKNRAIQHG